MGKQTLSDKFWEWLSGIAFAIYLWTIGMTEEQFWTLQDRDARADLDNVLWEIEQAYPEDIFPETTAEERAPIIEKYPGFIDRTTASMGRHLVNVIRRRMADQAEEREERWQETVSERNKLRDVLDELRRRLDERVARMDDEGGEDDRRLREVCQALVDYRRRAGALNFQLEKADDFLREIELILAGERSTLPGS